VASLHRLVLASRLAPATLSSSGALVSAAQPLTNQATATTLIKIFMNASPRPRCEIPCLRSLSSPEFAFIAKLGNRVTPVIEA
jgi:hypothetical protein